MTRWMNLLAGGCLAVLSAGAAQAAEITVLGGMGVISGVRDLAAGFQSATGNKVNAVFDALSEEDAKKVVGGNAAKMFGF